MPPLFAFALGIATGIGIACAVGAYGASRDWKKQTCKCTCGHRVNSHSNNGHHMCMVGSCPCEWYMPMEDVELERIREMAGL